MTLVDFMSWLSTQGIGVVGTWVNVYALAASILGVVLSTPRLRRFWRTRHLQRVWGIRNGDSVIVVCSELDEPEERQFVEPREFIYSLKYGDVDAYFDVVVTLLRLYPRIKLRIMSAGELEATRLDLASHLVLVGGPDYNSLTERIVDSGETRFEYRSPDGPVKSNACPDEIVLHDRVSNKEYCHSTTEKDYGYFERIPNPLNSDTTIVFIGGCHTIGVTGAVSALSMAHSEQGEVPRTVLKNALTISKLIRRKKKFAVLVSVERIGQTISTPVVSSSRVFL
jgi:hypothetical protein